MNFDHGIPLERWEIFFHALRDRLSEANEKNPSARYWKGITLRAEIINVIKRNRPKLLTTFPPAYEVMEHLQRIGWIQPIKVQYPEEVSPIEFFLADMAAGENELIDPLELLQAYLPSGVICYFSALVYYELTTQVAAHHHIAQLNRPKPKANLGGAEPPKFDESMKRIKRNPLGTEIFRFHDVIYYKTRRDASLIPGIQIRIVSPRSWLRVTTMEQTLLDTLLQPLRCGGEAVVLEAWEIGIKRIDVDRMAEHLAKIGREDLDRRVGTILDLVGADFSSTLLGSRLKRLKERLTGGSQDVVSIPLLPSFTFTEWNDTWKVQVP